MLDQCLIVVDPRVLVIWDMAWYYKKKFLIIIKITIVTIDLSFPLAQTSPSYKWVSKDKYLYEAGGIWPIFLEVRGHDELWRWTISVIMPTIHITGHVMGYHGARCQMTYK